MADIFLSYVRPDRTRVAPIVAQLRADGFAVWWDDDIPPDAPWEETIEKALEAARVVVVCWSSHAIKSENVRSEARWAKNNHRLIQLFLDKCEPPLFFGERQGIELIGWDGDRDDPRYQRLIGKLAGLIGPDAARPALVSSSPAPASAKSKLSRRFMGIALLTLLVVALLGYGGWRWFAKPAGSGAGAKVVIAVLPFDPLSPQQASLADGLWEDTRTTLSHNPAFQVIGRTTTKILAKDGLTPSEWRKRVGADYLLDGSLRESDGRVRAAVELARATDGVSIWEHSFEAPAADALAFQQTIAAAIEGRLRARLAIGGGVTATQIGSTREVMALYNQARAIIRQRDQVETAVPLLRQAVAADPNFAPAWAALGVALQFSLRTLSGQERIKAESLASVRHALSLAPRLAEGYAALGLIEGPSTPAGLAALRRSLALDPNVAEVWNWFGNGLGSQGYNVDAVRAYQQALDLDPLWPIPASNLANWLGMRNDRSGVERLAARVKQAGGDRAAVQAIRSRAAFAHGDFAAAILPLVALRRDPRLSVDTNVIGEAFAALGLGEVTARLFGLPDWSGQAMRGEIVPPMIMDGKPVNPHDMWNPPRFGVVVSRALLDNGQGRRLASLYHQGFTSSDDAVARLSANENLPYVAPNLVLGLRANGETAEADALLDAADRWVSERLARAPNNGDLIWELGRIRAVQGRSAAALDLIERAGALGWYPNGFNEAVDLLKEPALAPLRSDPRFAALRMRYLNHIASERAKLGNAANEL